MDDFLLDLSEDAFTNDFTIIYKGKEEREGQIIEPIEEIRTSKEKFLQKLRYFQKKSVELKQATEIFIHDEYSIQIFKDFIGTFKTKKIYVNEKNYEIFYKLSIKYDYFELKKQIEFFVQNRPDLKQIVDNISSNDIDFIKEEKISKNLDVCLLNENMVKCPIQVLVRILNSPKRVINDHHLLFSFIKKVVKFNVEQNNNCERYIQQLYCSLDYLKMSNSEIDELFSDDHFSEVFNCQHSKEKMKILIDNCNLFEQRLSDLEKKFDRIEKRHDEDIQKIEKKHNEGIQKIEKKHNEGIQKIEKKHDEDIQNIQKNYDDYIKNIDIKQKNLEKLDDEVKEKVLKQEKIIFDLSQEIQKLKNNINELKSIKAKLSVQIQEDQSIKGKIEIIRNKQIVDQTKSKYILNTNNSSLGIEGYDEGALIDRLPQEFSITKPAGTYYLHALIASTNDDYTEFISQPVTTKGFVQFIFNYTGRVQSVTLNPGRYKLEVWGSEGGNHGKYNVTAGKGGYSVGFLTIKSQTTLYVYVGESPTTRKGGWNGGGNGGSDGCIERESAGGGGSTDISLYGTEGSTDWNNSNHLFSRIIVAGAGGGSGDSNWEKYFGGYGGGLNGQSSGYGPKDNEGTQTRSGRNTSYSEGQGFGIGGSHTVFSSGGGGGWFGGGASNSGGYYAGGSGGSGYVYDSSSATNYPSGCKLNSEFYLTNASTFAGNTSFPTPDGKSTEIGHRGNGYAKITLQRS